jgi:peptidoglycan/LPS O-acetylase OafA/YrhL
MSRPRDTAAHVAPSRDSSIGYRPALDGIRAVAVLAVIAYHLGYGRIRGGFLGVDVFFVLSGYLITSLLLSEHARTGAIDLVAFWYRRARRLLPALFLMLIVVAVWIGASSPAFELEMRREDILWTLFYGANWHYIATGQDYFAQFASASPLRHTWSLAIEEQFYLAWPLIVGTALWLGRRRPAVVGAICVAGIAVSVAAMALLYDPGDPSRAYYGTDTRMHELLVGASLAVLFHSYARRRAMVLTSRAAPAVAVAAGLALLVVFARLSDTDALYYRGVSLLVAVGAAALIWSVEVAPRSVAARLLSLGPVAWVGRISYGLYLWHWPVILAVTTRWGPFRLLPGSFGLNGERVALTFAIAMASFYLLEQPIRRGRMPVLGPSVRRFAIAALVAIVAVGGTAYWQTSAASPETTYNAVPNCPNLQICLRREGSADAPIVAVVGDSIARSLDPGFADLAHAHGWTYVLEASNACRVSTLLTSVAGVIKPGYQHCYDQVPGLERELLATWHPDLIVVIDRVERTEALVGGQPVAAGTPEFQLLSTRALTDFARMMTAGGSRLVFLELPPVVPASCLVPSKLDSAQCAVPVNSDAVTNQANSIFRAVAAAVPGVSSISISDAICPAGACAPVVGGLMLRYDGDHFSGPAAEHLAPIIYQRQVAAGAFTPAG